MEYMLQERKLLQMVMEPYWDDVEGNLEQALRSIFGHYFRRLGFDTSGRVFKPCSQVLPNIGPWDVKHFMVSQQQVGHCMHVNSQLAQLMEPVMDGYIVQQASRTCLLQLLK